MQTETLYFKDKSIQGTNAEIVFHKDFTYSYNQEVLPVVKYTLINCEDLASKTFDDIDYYNDGVFVEVKEADGNSVFIATDMGGRVFQIHCQKVIIEELEYRKQDYIDLIQEIIKQRDGEYERATTHYKHYEEIKTFLEKEVDVMERKVNQASWLTSDKKKFLEGEIAAFRKVLELIKK